MMIPEENTKNRLSDEAIDEDNESTAVVELYNIRKSIENVPSSVVMHE